MDIVGKQECRVDGRDCGAASGVIKRCPETGKARNE